MTNVSNPKLAGRLAGLTYLALIVFSIFGYVTLTRRLDGDPQTVLARLAANRTTFTMAFVSSAIGFAAWVVLGALLYRLMGAAGRLAGIVMLIFVVAGTAMSLYSLWQLLPLAGSGTPGMDAATFAPIVESYRRVLLLAQVFSGLWMFPFGWLVLRSQIVPRALGMCLTVGGLGYLMIFATAFAPSLNDYLVFRVISIAIGAPSLIGEFGTCLWLLARGAREPSHDARLAQSA